jgi:hypothetical protein
MRTALAMSIVTLVACGGQGTPPASVPTLTETPPDAGSDPFDLAAKPVPTIEQLCDQARKLAADQCEPFVRWPVEMLDKCVIDGLYVSGAQACYMEQTCDRVNECIDHVIANGAPYRGPTSDCDDPRRTLPAGMTEAEMADSYGRTAKKYSDAPSTKERPIEVCGIPAESVYLLRATCDDGSRPFPDYRTARVSRSGNVGSGGRCRRIIDRFVVPCPEQQYEVFIDAYRCPANPT